MHLIIWLIVAIIAIIIILKIVFAISKFIFKLVLIGVVLLILCGLLALFFLGGNTDFAKDIMPSCICYGKF